jgi:hypothetical protein
MENFAGMLEYLLSWVWVDEGTIRANGGAVFSIKALPLIIEIDGSIIEIAPYVAGQAVFHSSHLAYKYLMHIARSDLKSILCLGIVCKTLILSSNFSKINKKYIPKFKFHFSKFQNKKDVYPNIQKHFSHK